MTLLLCFLAGGMLCVLAQWCIRRWGALCTLVGFAVGGVVLAAVGLWAPLQALGREGVSLMLAGSGAAVFQALRESVKATGLAGLLGQGGPELLRWAGLNVCCIAVAAAGGFWAAGKRR